MAQVSVKVTISNIPTEKNGMKEVNPIVTVVEGKNLASAIGSALHKGVQSRITSAFDTPKVVFESDSFGTYELASALINKCRKNHFEYILLHLEVAETVLADLSLVNQQTMVEYIRRTDVNGVFKSTKDERITIEQVAAQASQKVKNSKMQVKIWKLDAEASVLTDRDMENRARLAAQAVAKKQAKLLAEKQQKQITA